MPKITFIDASGTSRDIEIASGLTLMEGARDAGVEAILADCGGACACATCHVQIDESWLGKVQPGDDMEADMLEFAAAPTDKRSRLSCQITVQDAHDGLIVHTPATQG